MRSQAESHYIFLRGHLDNLEGTQNSSLFSWSRFELGYETVLVHGLLLSPPRLEVGDEVIVAGKRHKTTFDAVACRKVKETQEERQWRKRNERLRKSFWFSLVAMLTVAAIALFLANPDRDLGDFLQSLGIGLGPIVSFSAVSWQYRAAMKELELALHSQ